MAEKKASAKKTTRKKAVSRKSPAKRRPARDPDEGKGAHVLELLYYYAAALVGVGLTLGGAVAVVLGLRTMILPDQFETVREGLRTSLHGLAFVIPGVTLLWLHLREARRRETWLGAPVFWGKVLYFYLASLIALGFVTVAFSGVLHVAVELALPAECVIHSTDQYGVSVSSICAAGPEARAGLNFLLVGAVAGGVLWWHLREARRTTAPGLA